MIGQVICGHKNRGIIMEKQNTETANEQKIEYEIER